MPCAPSASRLRTSTAARLAGSAARRPMPSSTTGRRSCAAPARATRRPSPCRRSSAGRSARLRRRSEQLESGRADRPVPRRASHAAGDLWRITGRRGRPGARLLIDRARRRPPAMHATGIGMHTSSRRCDRMRDSARRARRTASLGEDACRHAAWRRPRQVPRTVETMLADHRGPPRPAAGHAGHLRAARRRTARARRRDRVHARHWNAARRTL